MIGCVPPQLPRADIGESSDQGRRTKPGRFSPDLAYLSYTSKVR